MLEDIEIRDDRGKILSIVAQVIDMLKKSNVVVPTDSTCEISHHYGLDRFYETGMTIINCINREYCKKILVILPGQGNPQHFHKEKEETFTVLYGELQICRKEKTETVKRGGVLTVERGVVHSFGSQTGCVFEEISTTHYIADSYYDDEANFISPRKTEIYITKEMLEEIAN
jgi:mannose-6-phosphate isomerase-like protein (cupin superfamily)